MSTRERIRFYLIDCNTIAGKVIDITLIVLNLLICSLFVIESYYPQQATLFNAIDSIVVSLFIIEFVLRFYAAEKRSVFLMSPYTIIDALAILPTLFRWFVPGYSASFLILLRLFRLLRIFRFMRFLSDETFFFGKITLGMLNVVRLIITFIIIFFISAGLFYYIEAPTNSQVTSYGDAFYYTVVTLTTVGFGDIIPITAAGRFVTTLMILSGIIFIPWQAGRIVQQWWRSSEKKKKAVCTSCGLRFHDSDATHCKHCGNVIYQEVDGSVS